jgi:hypothetical protein
MLWWNFSKNCQYIPLWSELDNNIFHRTWRLSSASKYIFYTNHQLKLYQISVAPKFLFAKNVIQYLISNKILTCELYIQGVYKIMARVQKLTRNLFLTFHLHNVHRQQRQLSRFLLHYQQLISRAYCGDTGPVSNMASQQEKAFCVLSFEVSRSVITVQSEFCTQFRTAGSAKARNKFLVNFWNCTILLWIPCIMCEVLTTTVLNFAAVLCCHRGGQIHGLR